MKALPHIVLCTEADSVVGLGHAVRCAGLLDALPVAHDLSVIGGGPVLRGLFPGARHIDAADWTGLDWRRLHLPQIDLVLADIPFHHPRDWDRIRHPDAPLIVIDDHGGTVPADVVINGTVWPGYQIYDNGRPPGSVCAGSSYALLRPEFAATPWRGKARGALTIVAGSGAQARDWLLRLVQTVRSLCRVEEQHVVVGKAFDALPLLRQACDRSHITLHVGLAAAPMATRLAASAVALVTAGMVLYETIAAGVPTVTFPQIADLVPEAGWFAERGACIDLGAEGGSPAAAALAVNRLLGDSSSSLDMSRRQRALLDGLGMARAAGILAAHLEGRR